jgi:hypothetical protein
MIVTPTNNIVDYGNTTNPTYSDIYFPSFPPLSPTHSKTPTIYSLTPTNSITNAYEKLRCYIVAKESDTDNLIIDVSLYIYFLFEYPYEKLFTRIICYIKYDTNNLINTSQTTFESPLYNSKWITELNTELNEKIIVINLGREMNEINEESTSTTKPEPLTKICNFKMQKKNSNYQINNTTFSGSLNSLSFRTTMICQDDLDHKINDQSCTKTNKVYGNLFDVSDSSLHLIKDIKNPADRYLA